MTSIKVFRGQLPRNNQFYSSEAPKNDGSDKPLGTAGLELSIHYLIQDMAKWAGLIMGQNGLTFWYKANRVFQIVLTLNTY